jgi:4-carboxymuconolactone decarboxylase
MSGERERTELESEAQGFLEEMVRRRGYVHEFHRVLAEHDLEFLRAYEGLLEEAYLRPRRLTRLTKALVYVAVLTAAGAPREQIRPHMVAAGAEGATSGDLLELLELVVPVAGVARFVEGMSVWREVFET